MMKNESKNENTLDDPFSAASTKFIIRRRNVEIEIRSLSVIERSAYSWTAPPRVICCAIRPSSKEHYSANQLHSLLAALVAATALVQ